MTEGKQKTSTIEHPQHHIAPSSATNHIAHCPYIILIFPPSLPSMTTATSQPPPACSHAINIRKECDWAQ